MFLSDLSIRRPILVTMGLVVFLLFGTLAYFGMNLQLTPDIKFPIITVQTIYPGAGPKEIEAQITKKIEDQVSPISKIDNITSYSMENISYVLIQFELDKDVYLALQEVKDKVDGILNELPDDAERPIVKRFDPMEAPVVDIVLSGNLKKTELYDLADKTLADRFSQIEGVANVDITGGQEREIKVELDNKTVFQNSVSLVQLAAILKAQNMDMPGGHFQKRSQEYSVKLKGEFDDVETIRDIEIPTTFGYKKLGDIAKITDSSEEVRERTTFFNNVLKKGDNNVILLSLKKASDGNAVRIAAALEKVLPQIQSELPTGCNLEIVSNNSIFIKSTVNDTLSNIILGVILTALVLLLFLHDYKSTIIVALSMPMSILSTFMFMKMSGYSLNIMTLMGLSTAVGVLVTNSVVVLENIFRHKGMGHNRKEAASKGTSEIVVAVIASAMTNIAVFLPIANMSSIVGSFFKPFAMTVVYATIFSLVMSFTLTPMLASLILPDKDTKKHPIGQRLEGMFKRWEDLYRCILQFILKRRLTSAAVILLGIIMFAASFIMASRIGFDFIPVTDEGDIQMEVELPVGYSLEETAELVTGIESVVKSHDEVKHILTTLGKNSDTDQGTNLSLVRIKLVDKAERKISTQHMASQLIRELSEIPNAKIRIAAVSSMGGGGEEAPLIFDLMGQNVDTLEVYKNKFLEDIQDVPGLVNLNTSSRAGKPEISIKPDRAKLADAGLMIADVALALRSALSGDVQTSFKNQGEEYDIRVMMNDVTVDNPEEIKNIPIVSQSGVYLLSQLCDIEFTRGVSRILHLDKYKQIRFSASVAPGYVLGNIQKEIDSRLANFELPSGTKIKWSGEVERMQEAVADMSVTFLIALLLTYMLLAAILESLTQPLMILGTVPLALIGVFGGLYITGLSMNIISMMAIIMLLGIVVNNAILQLDYTNSLIREKKFLIRDALLEACPTKLKPILMSSIAIILGMLPMALGMGDAGREIRQPMGVVSIGGLIVSTALSLFIIPAIFNLTSKEKNVKKS